MGSVNGAQNLGKGAAPAGSYQKLEASANPVTSEIEKILRRKDSMNASQRKKLEESLDECRNRSFTTTPMSEMEKILRRKDSLNAFQRKEKE